MKSLLVTGCAGLIGKQIAKDFLAEDWKVVGIDIHDCDLKVEDQTLDSGVTKKMIYP